MCSVSEERPNKSIFDLQLNCSRFTTPSLCKSTERERESGSKSVSKWSGTAPAHPTLTAADCRVRSAAFPEGSAEDKGKRKPNAAEHTKHLQSSLTRTRGVVVHNTPVFITAVSVEGAFAFGVKVLIRAAVREFS